jgi:hypothetical protein
MTTFNWKILEISADGDVITHAKYHVTAMDDSDNKVETEGNWWFSDKIVKKPFNEVTESDVAEWIEKETTQDGVNLIKSRLEEQLASLKGNGVVVAPWLPQIFVPKV